MGKWRGNSGFTLIELMVVIAIIMVLMGILFPVFRTVRESSKRASCTAHLQQLATMLKSYREDFGYYPPAPYFDAGANRYVGGFSALVPDYVTDKSLLICPSDRQVKGHEKEAKDRAYCSYNGWVTAPATTWDFADASFTRADDTSKTITGPTRYYNYYGYCQEGADPYWIANPPDDNYPPYMTTAPTWLTSEGLRLRHYPRLMNRNAPNNTYITHCVYHRDAYRNASAAMDLYLNVGGTVKLVNVKQMEKVESGASTWIKQNE